MHSAAGTIDAAIFASELDGAALQRALANPDIRLMNVAQSEAIAKAVPGLQHVTLWRGLINLRKDVPSSDVELLAVRNRLLIRKELHPALQYLLLEAMREVHSPEGPFNRLGEFPANSPMIYRFLQQRKLLTVQGRPSGKGTCHSG